MNSKSELPIGRYGFVHPWSAPQAHGTKTVAGAAALLLLTALGGCAAVTTAGGERLPITSQRFADYAEQVFRDQNRIATNIAFALEDAEGLGDARYTALLEAEDALLTACAGLNEVASDRQSGERSGVRRQISAARQVPECERAADDAAAVLQRARE